MDRRAPRVSYDKIKNPHVQHRVCGTAEQPDWYLAPRGETRDCRYGRPVWVCFGAQRGFGGEEHKADGMAAKRKKKLVKGCVGVVDRGGQTGFNGKARGTSRGQTGCAVGVIVSCNRRTKERLAQPLGEGGERKKALGRPHRRGGKGFSLGLGGWIIWQKNNFRRCPSGPTGC